MPKSIGFGVSTKCASMPVPVSGTWSGLDTALLTIVSVPLSAPLTDGVKVTPIVHVALGATGAPEQVSLETA